MHNTVPVYWHRSINFGDNIGPYLVEKITGMKAVYVSPEENIEHIALVGSLLDIPPLNNTIVWGCGFAYEEGTICSPKEICAVRGRLSREKYLNSEIDCPEIYGDPALLLPRFYNPEIQKKYSLGIIPHVVDYVEVLKQYANRYPDTKIIDLSQSVEMVISQILSCENTISSSLHGLIVSHAYGVRCRWVEFSDKVLGSGFKFRDYFTTIESAATPLDLRSCPELATIQSEIFEHEIKINLDKLLSVCPL